MTTATSPRNTFESTFKGLLIEPGAATYDDARRVHNGMVDRNPACIARCRGTADIVAAVEYANAARLDIAVRGGGHNVAGRAICDDGIVIDLSDMRGVLVDPTARTARVQAGATWDDFNRETQLHGLACTGGVISSTGVAGLTLGGGLGWLMGTQGLSVDNLISAEVVTASGEVIRASKDSHPDLFWALRGGGGNFGVVSNFEFQLHPVGPTVVGGVVAHPLEAARDVLSYYRDFTANAPDEVTAFAGLIHAPDGSGAKLSAIVACHNGPIDEGEAALRPLKEFGSPVMDAMGPVPYATLNSMLDDGFPRGALNYWKASFLDSLPDDAIDTLIAAFQSDAPPMSSLMLEHFHGAVSRVPVEATACPHRSVGYNLLIAGQWTDPATNDASIAWARSTYDAMRPYMSANRYVNYLGDDEGADATAAAFGPNYPRLQAVKKQYDPENRFHWNQNITPA